MKKTRKPDRLDLEAIRNQILDFACTKHDFKRESEDFFFDGNWNGEFLVKFDGIFTHLGIPYFKAYLFSHNLLDLRGLWWQAERLLLF